jgi:hypothetical protein
MRRLAKVVVGVLLVATLFATQRDITGIIAHLDGDCFGAGHRLQPLTIRPSFLLFAMSHHLRWQSVLSEQQKMRNAVLSLTEEQIRTLPEDKAAVLFEIRKKMLEEEVRLALVYK